MNNISNIRSELISLINNNRISLDRKKNLLKKKLNTVNTYLESVPNDINKKKNIKINNILSIFPLIKYNSQIKKIFKLKLINYLTTNNNTPHIDTNNSGNKNILILETTKPKDIENTEEIEETDEKIDSETDTVTDEEIDSETDEETDEESVEETDSEDEDSDADELDNTVHNLLKDLADDVKAKLIIKFTKYKLEHEYNIEAEKNRNIERMEELAIKKLKVKNKYKLKKLENRK
jgi:hypothetical protein